MKESFKMLWPILEMLAMSKEEVEEHRTSVKLLLNAQYGEKDHEALREEAKEAMRILSAAK